MASWSGRGQGSCPRCSTSYSSRWKPANCSKWGFKLGGSAPVAKAQKMCCPPAVNIGSGLYSIRTSSRDNRCFVFSESGHEFWICLHSDCKDVQTAYVSRDCASEFKCQHINQVPESVSVLDTYNLTAAKIAAYPCDAATKGMLHKISVPLGCDAVYRVSDCTYVVNGPPSATHTLGFCHVKVESGKKADTAFHWCSCKSYESKRKQEKSHAVCIHLHVLFCSLELYKRTDSSTCTTPIISCIPGQGPNRPTSSGETASQESNNSPTSSASNEAPSVSRGSTLNLYSSFKLPYHFGSEYLNNVSVKDASSLFGFENGWPSVSEVKKVTCQICGAPLGASKCHPGQRGNSILYTNLNPFKEVEVKVKECTSLECRAMHRVCPTKEGIILFFYNILCTCPQIFFKSEVWK